MITPDEIRKKAAIHYRQWLSALARGNPVFEPLIIRRTGDQKKAAARWDSLSALVAHSKEKTGYGYRMELAAPAPNSKNKQSRLQAIVIDTAADLVQYLGKTAELEQFQHSCTLINAIPALTDWCATHVREVLQYAAQWPQLLAVVRFFQENPAPGLPVRLLPVEGVDSKFIEQNNGILCRLLDEVLAPETIHKAQSSLAKRYGLPEQAPLLECAWNDSALSAHYGGFNRLAFPADQLGLTPLAASRILVVENKNSILQVLQQPFPDGMVISGGGFGVSLLQHCKWLHQKSLYYWGDLDAHGLAILSHFRSIFPHTRAVLMDVDTLEAYSHAWVPGKPYPHAAPAHLNAAEAQLFERLNQEGIRLEQERIVFHWPDNTAP